MTEGGLQLGNGAHGADGGRRTSHVVLHLLHTVGGLDRDAAGIERDAFADQGQVVTAERLRRQILHHDEKRRIGAALGDSQERTHAQLFHGGLVENFAGHVEFGAAALGRIRQFLRSQLIGRFIHQIARKVLRFPDDAAPLNRLLRNPSPSPPVTTMVKVSTCFSFFFGSDLYLSGSQFPISAPSAAPVQIFGVSLSGSCLRLGWMPYTFGFAVRASTPANRRASTEVNLDFVPAAHDNSRFAATPSGRYKMAISYSLPVNSPLWRSSASHPDWRASGGSFTPVAVTALVSVRSSGLKTEHSQRISFQFLGRRTIELDLHGLISGAFIRFQISLISIRLERQLLARTSAHCSLRFGLHFLRFDGFALVMKLLTLRGGDLQLDPAAFQVQLRRDDGESFFARLRPQFIDFRAMQQQFALSGRGMIHDVAVRVLADVGVQQPHLVFIDFGVAFFQLNFAAFGGFDFGAGQHDARFIAVQEEEIVPGGTIVAQNLKLLRLFQSDDSTGFDARFPRQVPSPRPRVRNIRWCRPLGNEVGELCTLSSPFSSSIRIREEGVWLRNILFGDNYVWATPISYLTRA